MTSFARSKNSARLLRFDPPVHFLVKKCNENLFDFPEYELILFEISLVQGYCVLLHYFIPIFHPEKVFRRSNKYLLRRYKRNMFRVVFR